MLNTSKDSKLHKEYNGICFIFLCLVSQKLQAILLNMFVAPLPHLCFHKNVYYSSCDERRNIKQTLLCSLCNFASFGILYLYVRLVHLRPGVYYFL